MRRTLAGLLILVLAVVAGTWVARAHDDPRRSLAIALDTIPSETRTANFTDWERIRSTVDPDISHDSAASAVTSFLDTAYDRDLSSVSVLAAYQQAMAKTLGWSVLDVDWEVYGQAVRGNAIVARLDDAISSDTVVKGLRAAGYAAPGTDSRSGGVWRGAGGSAAPQGGLSTQMANIAVFAHRHLVVMSGDSAYARHTADVVAGTSSSFATERSIVPLAQALTTPDVAVIRSAATACNATSFDKRDASDREAAATRVKRAGKLRPYTGLAFGLREGGRTQYLEVAMHFGTDRTAREQMRVRGRLASGDATGQGGTFGERFATSQTAVVGSVGVLGARLRDRTSAVLSDLGVGPLLFAWCGDA